MLRVSKILFPVDFSERCTAAASQVAAWALHFKAKLTLLHVLETPPVWYADLAADELEALVPTEELLRENRSRLDLYLRDEFRPDGPCYENARKPGPQPYNPRVRRHMA